jgi:hypothetical protein
MFPLILFLSALLMFAAENMVAKTLLPILGGSPAVWNVCMSFFQLTLLAGYTYAWGLSRQRPRVQVAIHLALLPVSLLSLPLALGPGLRDWLAASRRPELALIPALLAMVGAPFFVLSATSPLLQHWFSRRGGDPKRTYRLYAASNAGSLLGLLGYPLLLEPATTLPQQSHCWGWAYATLTALITVLGLMTLRRQTQVGPPSRRIPTLPPPLAAAPPAWPTKLRWLGLAALPCSLMLGVTTHITSDLAAVPLLWTIPLAIYLLTLIIVFRRRTAFQNRIAQGALPILTVAVVFLTCIRATEPTLLIVSLHLALFGCIALQCHGKLVDLQPPPRHLTQYYFWIAAGGALGSLLNSLLAPCLFRTAIEYPLALVAALLWIGGDKRWPQAKTALLIAGLAAGLTAALLTFPRAATFTVAATAVTLYLLKNDRLALGGATAATLAICAALVPDPRGKTIFVARDFFGISKVMVNAQGLHQITHGNTIHGAQARTPERERTPLLYYHPRGPFGTVFEEVGRRQGPQAIALAGLGAGALLAYSQPGQSWTVYEIDPVVVRIARSPALFSYLTRSAVQPQVILGDARLKLKEAPPGAYDALIIDVFSSDSVPTHLLTREAVSLYLAKLKPDGLLALHISNRSLDLLPIVAGIAAQLNLVCQSCDDSLLSPADQADGKSAAHVVLLHRPEHPLPTLARHRQWRPIQGDPRQAWTDDFSNLLAHLK